MRLDEIEIVPYDEKWAGLFAQQQERVAQALRPWLVGPVEHIGSTSVPGLPAKAIIDMMARVSDIAVIKTQAMQAIGWVPAPEPGDVDQRKLSFCYPSVEKRSHHLHVVEHASEGWKTWLAFRDRLRRIRRRQPSTRESKESWRQRTAGTESPTGRARRLSSKMS